VGELRIYNTKIGDSWQTLEHLSRPNSCSATPSPSLQSFGPNLLVHELLDVLVIRLHELLLVELELGQRELVQIVFHLPDFGLLNGFNCGLAWRQLGRCHTQMGFV